MADAISAASLHKAKCSQLVTAVGHYGDLQIDKPNSLLPMLEKLFLQGLEWIDSSK